MKYKYFNSAYAKYDNNLLSMVSSSFFNFIILKLILEQKPSGFALKLSAVAQARRTPCKMRKKMLNSSGGSRQRQGVASVDTAFWNA